MRQDFGKLFDDAGLECDLKVVGSVTKVLSARKPLVAPQRPAAATAVIIDDGAAAPA